MSRPCNGCNRVRIGEPYSAGRDCRFCWLYYHSPSYNVLWGGDGTVLPVNGAPERLEQQRVVEEATADPAPALAPRKDRAPCQHIGRVLDRNGRACTQCWTYECEILDRCIPAKDIKPDVPTCTGCPHYKSELEPVEVKASSVVMAHKKVRPLNWAYGVTTVPERRTTLLPATLESLKQAGFGKPYLFVDGTAYSEDWARLGLQGTWHTTPVGAWANWILGLYELFIRNPSADYYLMFQDDLLACQGLEQYLAAQRPPEKTYLNLFTFMENEQVVTGREPGWYEGCLLNGGSTYHNKPQQAGRGAVALLLPKPAVLDLLISPGLVLKPLHADGGKRKIDAAVVEALNKAGWRELVHNPSLVEHTGTRSTLAKPARPGASTWRGTGWNALSLLEQQTTV